MTPSQPDCPNETAFSVLSSSTSYLPDDSGSEFFGGGDGREEHVAAAAKEAVLQNFNISPEEFNGYDFDFPDFNLDEEFPDYDGDNTVLGGVDDTLLELVCAHYLDQEEKPITPEVQVLSTSTQVSLGDGPQHRVSEGLPLNQDMRLLSNRDRAGHGDDSHNGDSDIYHIPPPPELTYESHDAAEVSIHQWTLKHNYNLSRRRVRYLPGTKVIWARNFECDRAGWPKCTQHLVDNERKRQMRGSKRCGCPMRLKLCAVSKLDVNGAWKIVHTGNNSEVHNHPAVEDVRVHAAHRQRGASGLAVAPQSMEDIITSQTAAGIPVATIRASILNSNPTALLLPKDIGNLKAKNRKQAMAAQTPVEALFTQLEQHNFFYRFKVDPDTHELLYLLWAHPATLRLYKLHCDVLIMDGTFKTNKYDLPLINVIAMTGMNTVLPVVQCFISGQTEDDYLWFLEALRGIMIEYSIQLPSVNLTDRELAVLKGLETVFPTVPSLICRWHLNKNVMGKVRSILGQVQVQNPLPGQDKWKNSLETEIFMTYFYKAVEARTENEFQFQCAILKELSEVLAAYLDQHWWKYKTKLVRCWTNKYKHFDYRDTSAVEGTHAQCKRWLQNSNGDLYTVFNRLLPWWISSASSVSIRASRDATILPYLFQRDRYTQVARIITVWALRATDALWKEAVQMLTGIEQSRVCTGTFRTVNGRPCVHELVSIIESGGQLLPTMFDLHWWIYRDKMSTWRPRILEPANRRNKRRKARSHRANHGVNGTARDPILAERLDRNHPAQTPQPFREISRNLDASSLQEEVHGHFGTDDQRIQGTALDESGTSQQHVQAQTNPYQTAVPIREHTNHHQQPYDRPYIPPRYWGYAGCHPY